MKLPRLISNGMVIQQKKKVHIWGWDEPGRNITISFLDVDYNTIVKEDGSFDVQLDESNPGGPFCMTIINDIGEKIIVEDILVGDVWMCSGQSNMELPMARVKDTYPEEIEKCSNPFIRTFKIVEHSDFHAPLNELLSGEWKQAAADTIMQFSATAYFFAKKMYEMTGIPIGFINASLGGSRVESWMGRDMLAGYDECLQTAEQYADDEFVKARLKQNEKQALEWHTALDAKDIGLQEHWEAETADETGFESVTLPCFFRDTKLKGFIGSVWFRREFAAPEDMIGKKARIWLGTIVDSDTVYINGVQVGHTDYQYPPRKYEIPEGLLKKENVVSIRVKCDRGQGRFTPGKKYAIFNEDGEIDLQGQWKYRIAASCEKVKETDFVNWKPTGLYNGMTAPCHKYTIAGILWYQGESNAGEPEQYSDLIKKMINSYREKWNDSKLPFLYVQLPNFEIDLKSNDESIPDEEWAPFRECQRRSLDIPHTGMAVAIDAGEDNDLHPVNKMIIGDRLAYLAAQQLYGGDSECFGPQIKNISIHENNIEIECENAKAGMYAFSKDKGNIIKDFEVADADGRIYPAAAELDDDKIIVSCAEIKNKPAEIRYCYKNTNKGALIYNKAGFPMSPFAQKI